MFEGFGVTWNVAGKISKKFEPFIRDYYPEALEEIAGVAEGAGLSYEDVLTINCRSEILFAKPDGCTTFGILPEQSCDGPRSNLGLAQTGSRHDSHFGSSC